MNAVHPLPQVDTPLRIDRDVERPATLPAPQYQQLRATGGVKRSSAGRGRFRPDRLPDAAGYFSEQGITLLGRGEWRSALCPFHEDSKPSLRVRPESGAFRCMACGAHGGDVLAFHMQRHGLDFVQAAKALGAWEAQR